MKAFGQILGRARPPARLLIHLGDFKTGTTALQHWLETDPPAGLAALPGAPHADLAGGLGDAAGTAERLAGIGRRLAEAPRGGALVVSAEHFEFADPARLHAALAAHLPGALERLRLLAWVRPHIPGLLARYAESVKIGSFGGSLNAYAEEPSTLRRMRYAERFGRWRAAFGDAVELRLYAPEALPGGDIRRGFALAATGTDPGPLPPSPAANPSLGLQGLAIARAVHAGIGPLPPGVPAGARWTAGRHLGRLLARRQGAADDAPLRIDRPLAQHLERLFGPDAAALDAAFFEGAPLREALAREVRAAPDAAPRPDPESLSPDLLLGVRLLAGFLADGLSTPERAQALDGIYHEHSGPFPATGERVRGPRPDPGPP